MQAEPLPHNPERQCLPGGAGLSWVRVLVACPAAAALWYLLAATTLWALYSLIAFLL